jgi:hypothetical protein
MGSLGGSYVSGSFKLKYAHVMGMPLITRATAHSNIAMLYDETLWLSIKQWHNNSVLTWRYNIKYDHVSDSLSKFLPPQNLQYI